jgi:hypothetical protein
MMIITEEGDRCIYRFTDKQEDSTVLGVGRK